MSDIQQVAATKNRNKLFFFCKVLKNIFKHWNYFHTKYTKNCVSAMQHVAKQIEKKNF